MTDTPNLDVFIDDEGRPEPPAVADEIETLLGFLDYQRATLEWKTRGLADEQLRAALHPTSMTLMGILAHMATVEDFWFTEVVGEVPFPEDAYPAGADTEPSWEWTTAVALPGDEVRGLWDAALARSRAVVAGQLKASGLDGTHPAWGGRANVSLRWVVVHMIEEYARHNGHADLLRESIDGATGE